MKNLFYLLIVAVGVYFGYQWYTGPGSAKKQPRLAPDGTYFMLEYVSVKTPSGMVGVVPGQEVHEVHKANVAPGRLQVNEGRLDLEVDRSQVTNDMDVADALRKQDQDAQHQLVNRLAEQKANAAKKQAALDAIRAEDVDRANKAALAAQAAASQYESPLKDRTKAGLSSSGGLNTSGVEAPTLGNNKKSGLR